MMKLLDNILIHSLYNKKSNNNNSKDMHVFNLCISSGVHLRTQNLAHVRSIKEIAELSKTNS